MRVYMRVEELYPWPVFYDAAHDWDRDPGRHFVDLDPALVSEWRGLQARMDELYDIIADEALRQGHRWG